MAIDTSVDNILRLQSLTQEERIEELDEMVKFL